jgi:hypothetical protein
MSEPKTDLLSAEFANPSAAWRGKPFWSWNGELDEHELVRQLGVFKQMGFGGAFFHSRTGLITEYLGDEWMRLTNACADACERLGLEAWLYDEDRWPSGTAGGLVTLEEAYRLRVLEMQIVPAAEFRWSDDLVAAHEADVDGHAVCNARRLRPGDRPARAAVLAFRVVVHPSGSFYNGQTYVDTMNRAATQRYIELTHERYREHCGDRLGTSIRGIFTDEPHRGPLFSTFSNPVDRPEQSVPWTASLPQEYRRRFGADLLDDLPALFLQPDGNPVHPAKWRFCELTQQLFLENFLRPLYEWCDRHRMILTGHVLHEDSLSTQVAMQGSLMRSYEHMQWPGIDMLTEWTNCYWAPKQLQSVARQLGQKWLLSELYGCVGWQFDFESHKAVGDWQTLFGINVRCHHLSWYTMEGEAKRDYPQSISFQSAFWPDYHHVETYFARFGLLNSAGVPCCDVLVINPIESVTSQVGVGWCKGLGAATEAIGTLEKRYAELFHLLQGAQIDFDYGDEEMLSRLASVEQDADESVVRVGQACYRAVVVGGALTLRSSTLELLRRFIASGGTVVTVGELPTHLDAVPAADAVASALARASRQPWDRLAVADALAPVIRHRVEIRDADTGGFAERVFCQLRRDGDRFVLLALNVDREQPIDAEIAVAVAGNVTEWDCLRGGRSRVAAEHADCSLRFRARFAPAEMRAYTIEPGPVSLAEFPRRREADSIEITGPLAYTLDEPNVCVLDTATWSIDGAAASGPAEVLRIDRAVRKHFGLPFRAGDMVQPWYQQKFNPRATSVLGKLELRFAFDVQTVPSGPVSLACERPERLSLSLNGRPLATRPTGWWIDRAFQTLALDPSLLRAGRNELVATLEFTEQVNVEAMYLLGSFGVRLAGADRSLVALPKTLAIGDVVPQGLPFYTGVIRCRVPVPAELRGRSVLLRTPAFEAACVKAVHGRDEAIIPWQPYEADVSPLLAGGAEAIELCVVPTRRNTFGPLHQLPATPRACGSWSFVTEGDAWTDDYSLIPNGLLANPRWVVVE